MKTFGANLTAHYASGATTLALGLKVERTDGTIYGFTSAQADVEISSVSYLAEPGLDITSLTSTAGTQVDNLELIILPDIAIFTENDLLAGRWNKAKFTLFEYNYVTPADGINVLKRGIMGDVRPLKGRFVVELRSLKQMLQQAVGIVTQPTCRVRLGSTGAGKCNKDITSFTYTFTVTSVTSNRVFRDSSWNGLYAAEWFDEGHLTWTGGDNEGLELKIKSSVADGTLTTHIAAFYDVQIGDTATVIAGCRKRLADCRDKFDNVLNFQGEPHLPGVDAITKSPI